MLLPLTTIGKKDRRVIFGISSSTNSASLALPLNRQNEETRRFSLWTSIYDSNQLPRILSLLHTIAKCARKRAMPGYAEHEVEFWRNYSVPFLVRFLISMDAALDSWARLSPFVDLAYLTKLINQLA